LYFYIKYFNMLILLILQFSGAYMLAIYLPDDGY
jgi:hypothetical protein